MTWPAHACRREDGKMLTRNEQLYPMLERTPDLTRGHQRLAAEVALHEMRGSKGDIPEPVRLRARIILGVMAGG